MTDSRPWMTTTAIALLALGAVRAAEDAADLVQQRDQQQAIKQETEKLVRQLETPLRVLQYYQLDKGAEKELLNEAVQVLAGLSKNQMNEVLSRLEAAGKA